MSQTQNPVLIIGGSGIVGRQAAEQLRRLHPDLPIAIGGRDLAKARAVADEIGKAGAVAIDLAQPDLGLAADRRFSAIAIFVKDHTLNATRFAQDRGIPVLSVSSGVFEIGPEMARYVHRPTASPILMASQWLAGVVTLPTLTFVRDFADVAAIRITATLDEEDMGGPAAAADFERLTRTAPNPLILKDNAWTWLPDAETTREVRTIDGVVQQAKAYSPLDVLSLANETGTRAVRFDLIYGESVNRRRGLPFSSEVIIEIDGKDASGADKKVRHEILHPMGQAPLTALNVALGIEGLLGLRDGKPAAPGLYFPENLVDPVYAVERLKEIGTEFRVA